MKKLLIMTLALTALMGCTLEEIPVEIQNEIQDVYSNKNWENDETGRY